MKKKLLAAMLAAVFSLGLMACANTDDMKYLKDFKPAKYVELGEYKGVEVALSAPEVTEEQIDSYIDTLLSYNPTIIEVTDRTDVREGDTVNLDYEGKRDGVAFDGGTATGASLTIGSGQFIEGFEAGMVGMQIGETKDLNLKFPDNYGNADLAGAEVVFTVTVNGITVEEPAVFDEAFVATRGIERVTTTDQYREYVRGMLLEQEEAQFEEESVEVAIDAVQAGVTFKKVPAGMTNRLYEVLISNMEAYAEMFGMEVGDYVAAVYEVDVENYEEALKNQAELVAQRYVMLAAIAEKEGITVTDEEVEAALKEDAAAYGYGEDVESYKAVIDVEAYKEYMIYNKVGKLIVENAVLTGAQETVTQ